MEEKTLQQRIDALPQTDEKNHPYILNARISYPRSHMKWTDQEDKILNDLIKKAYWTSSIAKLLKRSPSAIDERLKIISLNLPNVDKKIEKKVEEKAPSSPRSINSNSFHSHKNPILNLIQYWRNSLADADKMGLPPQKVQSIGKQFSLEQFQQGKLAATEIKKFFDQSEKNLRIKNNKNYQYKNNSIDESDTFLINKLPVIIAPFTANKIHQHGKEIVANKMPKAFFPLWIIADLTRMGDLIVPTEDYSYPWIARECLTPNEARNSYPIIGDISQVDNFYTQKKYLLEQGNFQWETLFSFAVDLLESLANEKKLDDLFLEQNYKLEKKGYILSFNDIQSSSKNIIATYDNYLFSNSKKIPILLQNFCSLEKRTCHSDKPHSKQFIADKSKSHLGQMQKEYPLSESQRISLSYFFDNRKNNRMFTVNGPPGTGKTSLLVSIIASKWVDAAIRRDMPPIMVVASTNNLAVTNVLDCFNKFSNSCSSDLSMRWLPNLTSYGLYLVAAHKSETAQKHNYIYQTKTKGSGSLEYFYTADYREQAKTYLLTKFNTYYQKQEFDLSRCQNHIHQQMLEKQALMEKTIELANNYYWLLQESAFITYGSVEIIEHTIKSYSNQQADLKIELNQLKNLRGSWLIYKSTRLNWLALFSWLRFVKLLLIDKVKAFTSSHHQFFPEPIEEADSVSKFLDELIAKRMDENNQIEKTVGELKLIKDRHNKLLNDKIALQIQLGFDFEFNNLFDFSDNQGLLAKLDLTLRYDLFLLATHYWEIAWLMESEVINSLTYDSNDRKKYWQIHAMLLPCSITTLHSGPAFFQYKNSSQEFEPLSDFLDLLIIDEAGQVMPAIAGAMVSIAKRAIFFGDIKQLEPIFSLTESIDFANAKKFKLCEYQQDYENLKENGILCSGDALTNHAYGNVILVGQRKAKYHLQNHSLPGMLLKEHRRCAKEIISYCNELCYNNQLVPMANEKACLYPRMGYAHIKGQQKRSGSSFFNQEEAQTIAHWIAKNKQNILTTCEAESLEDCIGIITPFFAQGEVIKAALDQYGLSIGKTGTIHSLQGAEKDIIIFSPVYSAESHLGVFFFDRSPNMLNVAVSRAKRSFLVFGDMDIFDQFKGHRPSSLLAKYLFAHEDNEIVNIIQPQFKFLIDNAIGDKNITQINTLDHHRKILKESFGKTINELTIVSPFLRTAALTDDNIPELVQKFSSEISINIYTDPTLNQKNHEEFMHAKATLEKAGAHVMLVNNVHSKIIVIDNRIIISGSFNWLSASRKNRQFIREESSIFYQGEYTAQFIQAALNPIKNKVKYYRPVSTKSPVI